MESREEGLRPAATGSEPPNPDSPGSRPILEAPDSARSAALRRLLQSPSDDERLAGLKLLLERPPRNLEAVLRQFAERDPSARLRYASRKALDLWQRQSRPAAPARPRLSDPAALGAQLASPDPAARIEAARRIQTEKLAELLPYVRRLLPVEADASVKATLVSLFELWGEPKDLALLAPLLEHEDHRVRANAVTAAARCDLHAAAQRLIRLLQDPDHRVRSNCAMALSTLEPAEVMLCLERMLDQDEIQMRDAAVYALGKLGLPASLPLLRRAMTDPSPIVREKAERGLTRMAQGGNAEAAQVLASLAHPEKVPAAPREVPPAVEKQLPEGGLEDANPKVRLRAITAMIVDQRRDRVEELVEQLGREESDFVVSKLIVGIGALGGPSHSAVVKEYLRHREPRLVASAIEALAKLGGAAAAVRPFVTAKSGRVRAAALLFLAQSGQQLDTTEALEEMTGAREFEMRLAGLYALDRLGDAAHTALLEPLLADLSDDVRHKAYELLEKRAGQDDPMARDLLEMCRQGFVDRKEQSVRLDPAPFNKRLLAFSVDLVAMCVTGYALLMAGGFAAGLMGLDKSKIVALLGAIGFVMAAGFFVRDSFRSGRGHGKNYAGLRLVDLGQHSGASPAKALIRTAFLGVPFLNIAEIVVALKSSDGRRLADRMLGTMVIDEKKRALTGGEWIFLACAYLVLGIVGWATVEKQLTDPNKAEALALRREIGVDARAAGWSVVMVGRSEAVLQQKSFTKGLLGMLALEWSRKAELSEPEFTLKKLGRKSLDGIRKSVSKSELKEAAADIRVDRFEDGLLCTTTADYASEKRRVAFRIYILLRGKNLLQATLSVPDAKHASELEEQVKALLKEAQL